MFKFVCFVLPHLSLTVATTDNKKKRKWKILLQCKLAMRIQIESHWINCLENSRVTHRFVRNEPKYMPGYAIRNWNIFREHAFTPWQSTTFSFSGTSKYTEVSRGPSTFPLISLHIVLHQFQLRQIHHCDSRIRKIDLFWAHLMRQFRIWIMTNEKKKKRSLQWIWTWCLSFGSPEWTWITLWFRNNSYYAQSSCQIFGEMMNKWE